MSKKGGRYNDDDYGDDDYYEDEYYDEDYVEQAKPVSKNAQPPSKKGTNIETPQQMAKQKSGFGAAPVASPGTAKASLVHQTASGIDDDAEREVLMATLPDVVAVIGNHASEASIIAALRAANYDANTAVTMLLSDFGSGDSTPARAVPSPVPVSAKSSTAPSPTSNQPPRKAGKLVLASPGSPPPAGADVPSPNATTLQIPSLKRIDTSAAASPTTTGPAYFPTAEEKVAVSVADEDGKLNISLVMAGHVDTGKSTILGHLLVRMGVYTDREVAKLEALARREGKATFHFAWILDQSEEERRRGVTIDSGVHSFETPTRRVSILDAPGHKDYVAAMITSAAQADLALFTVSAAPGEFESGLNHMTREHLSVVRTLGIPQVVVLVNKMDSAGYSQERFKEIVGKIEDLAKSMNFREGVISAFCPISGYLAVNLLPGSNVPEMSWYQGPSLVELVDQCQPARRMLQYPLRMFVSDVAKQTLSGKIETGQMKVGDQCVIVPSGNKVTIKSIERPNVGQVKSAAAGCTVDVTVTGDLLGITVGDVLCPPKQRCPIATTFEAHVQLFANLPTALMPGSKLLLQMQAINLLVTVKRLVRKLDPKTGQWSTARMVKCLAAETQGLVEFELPHPVPIELAEDNRALGRFILRQEDETVGGGLVRAIGGASSVAAPAQ